MLTESQFASIFPTLPAARRKAYMPLLLAAMAEFKITTRKRAAAFLAQLGHESRELTKLVENMNYRADRLLEVFPRYFDHRLAIAYAHQPAMIASRVYANRMGNGPESSSDGWKYIARGGIGRTGKNNYARAQKALDLPLLENPALLEVPAHAFRSDALFWADNSLNSFADRLTGRGDATDLGLFDRISKVINGGNNGREDRRRRYQLALRVLNDEQFAPSIVPNNPDPPPPPSAKAVAAEQTSAPEPQPAPAEEVKTSLFEKIQGNDTAKEYAKTAAANVYGNSRTKAVFHLLWTSLAAGEIWAWLGLVVAVVGVGAFLYFNWPYITRAVRKLVHRIKGEA